MRALEQATDRVSAIHHAVEHGRGQRTDHYLGPGPAVATLADELCEGVAGGTALPSVAVLPFRTRDVNPRVVRRVLCVRHMRCVQHVLEGLLRASLEFFNVSCLKPVCCRCRTSDSPHPWRSLA